MHLYAIALGSNRRHGRHGTPRAILAAAIVAVAALGTLRAVAPVHESAALGPGGRRFANGAILLATPLDPPRLLAALKAIERAFGRRRGRRWGARVLDLDIVLWSGGRWRSHRPALRIPHIAMTTRGFVLHPLDAIAPDWAVPRTGRAVRHHAARLTRRAPFHRSRSRSGP